MWKYLREFLSDKRIIELTKIFWYPILYGIILLSKTKKVGKVIRSIWNKNKNESPLKVFTRNCKKITNKYNKKKIEFSFAMNYGFPRIRNRIRKTKKKRM